jgi:hypothetical protein
MPHLMNIKKTRTNSLPDPMLNTAHLAASGIFKRSMHHLSYIIMMFISGGALFVLGVYNQGFIGYSLMAIALFGCLLVLYAVISLLCARVEIISGKLTVRTLFASSSLELNEIEKVEVWNNHINIYVNGKFLLIGAPLKNQDGFIEILTKYMPNIKDFRGTV